MALNCVSVVLAVAVVVARTGGGQNIAAGVNPLGAAPQAGGDPVAVRAQAGAAEGPRRVRTGRRAGALSRGESGCSKHQGGVSASLAGVEVSGGRGGAFCPLGKVAGALLCPDLVPLPNAYRPV